MKVKDFALSIILNAFLGYLWLLFITHITNVANSMNNPLIVGGTITIIGCLLFYEVFNRVSPFNKHKFTHPVKLSGMISFAVVVGIHLFVVSLI